jgi:hypothetical protein
MSGQEGFEAVVEWLAEKLGIVSRGTEGGSLGWKLFRQHVADDAKGVSGNLADWGGAMSRPGDNEFRKGCCSEAFEGHFGVPGRRLACGGGRGCRVSLIQLNRWQVEPQCLVERPRQTAQETSRHPGRTVAQGARRTSPRPRFRGRSTWPWAR